MHARPPPRSGCAFSVLCRKYRYLLTAALTSGLPPAGRPRSEEHTSELQSRSDLVCRLLLEKKKAAPRAFEYPAAVRLPAQLRLDRPAHRGGARACRRRGDLGFGRWSRASSLRIL